MMAWQSFDDVNALVAKLDQFLMEPAEFEFYGGVTGFGTLLSDNRRNDTGPAPPRRPPPEWKVAVVVIIGLFIAYVCECVCVRV